MVGTIARKPIVRPDVAAVNAVIEPLWHRGIRTPLATTRAYAMACLIFAMCRTAVAARIVRSSCHFPGGKMLLELIKKGTLAAVTIAAIAASTTAAAAWNPPDFPRVGGI